MLNESQLGLAEVDKELKKDEVAKKYGIFPSTLSIISKNRESILKQLQTSVFVPSRKRMRKAQFEDYLDYLADDNVSTCYELTKVDITQSIKDSKDEATDESSKDEEAVMRDDVRNITSSEALSSLEVMRTFISSQSDVWIDQYRKRLKKSNLVENLNVKINKMAEEEN
ncbi:DNA binding HTH domain, Psq-type [Cinara cedri]|uniref:DNA binding HTH domain, Psq-type n=1 Tax=Cinara cedri TaxID=506608 RepID=A0A5E4LWV9_9HEMI|nr:DNA binding HTH domain, Psq-type [Cinara cedri]